MENVIEINGRKIEKNLCSCMVCYIEVNLIGVTFNNNPIDDRHIFITHSKVYSLIEQYGISKVTEHCITIKTSELTYYIDLTK